MTKRNGIAILAVALAFIMLFSALYIAIEADHDCHGEDCAICAQICACIDLLKHIGLSFLIFAAVAILRLSVSPTANENSRIYDCASLVSLRVKLSD